MAEVEIDMAFHATLNGQKAVFLGREELVEYALIETGEKSLPAGFRPLGKYLREELKDHDIKLLDIWTESGDISMLHHLAVPEIKIMAQIVEGIRHPLGDVLVIYSRLSDSRDRPR
jgi:hypothetical protein